MPTPKRYLFAITDGGGSVPPDASVVRALVDRGHDVRVLADRVLAPDVATTGAEHIPWTTAPQRPDLGPTSMVINDWDAKTPQEAFVRVMDGVMTGPAQQFADDVRAELRRRPADAVVSNFFLMGAQIAGQAERVPVAVLIPNLFAMPGWGIPPIGPGLKPMRGPVGRAPLRPPPGRPERGPDGQRPRAAPARAGPVLGGRPHPDPDQPRIRVPSVLAAVDGPLLRPPAGRSRVGGRL